MNTPGTPNGNWTWRFPAGLITPGVRTRLADMTAVFGRWNGELPEVFQPPRPVVVEEPAPVVDHEEGNPKAPKTLDPIARGTVS
jgi:hypothetical protein